VVRVTGDFFNVLGVKPMIGRPFGRAEDTPGTNDVVVLGYGFWQSRFAGDQRVIGKVIDLDGRPMRVMGVMPEGFAFPRPDAQLYEPLGLDPTRLFGFYITGIGRLAPGATIDAAQRSSTALMWEWTPKVSGLLPAGVRPRDTRMSTLVTPYRDAITADVARPLAVLQAAVVLILLIAIANVATLLSSRSAARARETALRNALGATSGRVVRQLLTESVTLAMLGGAAGVAMAYGLVQSVTHSNAVSLPRIAEVGVSLPVLAFALSTTIVAGLAFGLAPAIGLARGRLADALAAGRSDGGSARGSSRRMNNILVAAQLALSVVLLVSAGLVLKSFRHLIATDLGFEPTGVTTIALPLPAKQYSQRPAMEAVVAQLVDRVRSVPGVSDAAIAWAFPYSGNTTTDGYVVEGHTDLAASGFETQTVLNGVSPGYFKALRIPLLYGRDFTLADRDSTLPVTVINEALSHRYWRGRDAIGKRIRVTGDTTWLTIVGVVGSVRDEDVAIESRPHSYTPFAQTPDPRPMLAIRTQGDPRPVIAAVRRAVAEVEPGIPLDNVRPLSSWISRALDTRRMTEMLLVGFGILAALLASVGIFGVMSLYVTHRYREFGIRLAVGAEPRNLVRLVLGQGATLAIAGLVVGVGGAIVATRWIRALLYEVSPTDPVVFALLPLALGIVAVASCYLPARRAAQSDPLTVLRTD
ncbi:MAG TPA: ABC transporter permease, partial [Gemmatimonadaceae bacterium]|nr:ABC transporter permease [Gemmatimonadaceae bacterium]